MDKALAVLSKELFRCRKGSSPEPFFGPAISPVPGSELKVRATGSPNSPYADWWPQDPDNRFRRPVADISLRPHSDIQRPLNHGPTCEGMIARAARATGW
jgi:hypothetical protein